MNTVFFCFVAAIVIVLLILDIIARVNASFWFRKGFDTAVHVMLTSVQNATKDLIKK